MADLTVAQFRAFPGTPSEDVLPDASLQILLDAAIAAVNEVAGATGEVTEHIHGHGYARITVARLIGTIASVTEDDVVLAADDYRASGYVIKRTGHGTNPSWRWGSYLTVVYTPADDTAERQRVQLELVKLDLAYQPGLAGQKIGTWEETYSASSVMNYEIERGLILASLGASGGGMLVVE